MSSTAASARSAQSSIMSATIPSPIAVNFSSSSPMKRSSTGGSGRVIDRGLSQADVTDRAAAVAPVGAAAHLVGRVALDRGDRAVGADRLDDADVLVPDDQVAGLRLAGAVRDRLAVLLGPGVDVVDAPEALAGVAQRDTRAAGGPGDEVGAPGPDARAGGGLAVLGDARGVVGARRLLGHADLVADGVEHGLAGRGAAAGAGGGRGGQRGERG